MSALHDDTVPFGMDNQDPNKLPHPYVTICHLAFRTAALFFYLFYNWFGDSFITNFVLVVLLLCADFWTVKNITGRLMVGLRWWNYIDDNGVSHWVYETKKGQSQNAISSSESRIFWVGLISFPIIWSLLFIVALFGFKFKWLLLVGMAISLSSANLHGYLKCKFGSNNSDFKSALSSATSNFFRQKVVQNVATMMDTSSKAQSSQMQV